MRALASSRKLWIAVLLALAGVVLLPLLGESGSRALAHPLGNFTINRYSRIELAPQQITLRYVLDMAEIPAFQERQEIDMDDDGEVSGAEQAAYARAKAGELGSHLDLAIGGKQIELRPGATNLSFPAGVGGLDTLRLVVDYTAAMPDGWQRAAQQVEFDDGNYADRAGWSEVVVRSQDGVRIASADVPAQDVTNELRAYPGDGLSNPLDVTGASFSFEPGAGTTVAATNSIATATQPDGRANDRFISLIANEELSVPFILGAMAVAFVFGTLHALGPGHGKTVVAAYLVGERGTARHAVLLGLLVTATHTSSVFALAGVTLYASQFIVPERLYPWLSLASGLLVIGLGGLLLAARLRAMLRKRAHSRAYGHDYAHAHEAEHGHSHAVPDAVSMRGLFALGISGGILPCPSALVVLLGAISLHRIGLGLLLVVAFSVGLATVLTAIGLALVWAGRVLARWQSVLSRRRSWGLALATKVAPAVPAMSALAVTSIGVAMTLRALGQPGVFGL